MRNTYEVVKSVKAAGSVAVRKEGALKWTIRKIFTAASGKPAFRIDNVDYTFEWCEDNHNTYNIEEVKMHDSRKGIADSIKDEMEAKKMPLPVAPKAPVAVKVPTMVKHEKYDLLLQMIQENIPVYLVGPAGSGKNHVLEMIAKDLDMDFYFTNSIQQEFKLTGFIDAGGTYHETEFYKAFNNGGLFFLDEMDASIPEVLVLLNAAIANGYFEFPNGKVYCNEEFRVVSAGNTFGNGADENYTGRMVLDQATLDRFAVVKFDYDRNIELFLAKGNVELVDFIRELRSQATAQGIRATFSYRCITMITKLEGKIKLDEVLQMVVFKGMDIDTLRTFKSFKSSKYHLAMKVLAM